MKYYFKNNLKYYYFSASNLFIFEMVQRISDLFIPRQPKNTLNKSEPINLPPHSKSNRVIIVRCKPEDLNKYNFPINQPQTIFINKSGLPQE